MNLSNLHNSIQQLLGRNHQNPDENTNERKQQPANLIHDDNDTVYATWDIIFNVIKNQENGSHALQILYISSYLKANDIPIDLFYKLINDKTKLKAVFDMLEKCFLINVKPGDQAFSIHKFLQQVIQIKMKEQQKEISILNEALTLFSATSNMFTIRYIEHALSLWKYASNFIELVKEFSIIPHSIVTELMKEKKYKEAYLFSQDACKLLSSLISMTPTLKTHFLEIKFLIAKILIEEGKYDESMKNMQEIYEVKVIENGSHHILTLATKHDIVKLMHTQGRYKEAKIEFLQLIKTSEMILNENHQLTMMIKDDYGKLLLDMDEPEEAYNIFVKIINTIDNNMSLLDINADISEIKNKITFITKNNMATALSNLGKIDEALKLYQESCKNKSKLDKDIIGILETKYNMAHAFIEKGDLETAYKFCKEIDTEATALGDENSQALFLRCLIGNIYYQQKKFNESLDIVQDVLKKQKQILKSNHPHTLKTQTLLGLIFHSQSKHKKALSIIHTTLKEMKNLMGNDHPETMELQRVIADIYFRSKEYHKSYECYYKLLCLKEKVYGQLDKETINIRSWVIRMLTEINEIDKVLQQYYILLDTQLVVFGIEHQNTCRTKNNIALILADKHEYDKALVLLKEVLEISIKTFGLYHDKTMTVRQNLANIKNRKNEYERSSVKNKSKKKVTLFSQKCNITIADNSKTTTTTKSKQVTQPSSQEYDEEKTRSELCGYFTNGLIHFENSKLDDALENFKETYKKQECILGPFHADTFKTQKYLAMTLHSQKKFAEALPIFQEVWKKATLLLGIDHYETLELYKGIANSYLQLGDYLQARQHFIKLLEIREPLFGSNNKGTIEIRALLIKALLELKEYDELFEHYYKTIESESIVFGPEHPRTISSKYLMAHIYANNLGDYDKALKIFNEVSEVQLRNLGPDHRDTVIIHKRINEIIQCKKRREEEEKNDKEANIQKKKKLLAAMKNSKLSEVETFIKQGVDVNVKNSDTKTLLHCAIDNCNKELVNLLLRYGADLFQIDNNGNTPLHCCVAHCNYEIVQLLLQNITPKKLTELLDFKNNDGNTSLHIAARLGSLDIVSVLLKHGASYNIKNNDNKSPINVSENEQILYFLAQIEHLFYDVENANNRTHNTIIRKLKSFEPDVFSVVTKTRNEKGCTLMQVAIINNHKKIATDILKLLQKVN